MALPSTYTSLQKEEINYTKIVSTKRVVNLKSLNLQKRHLYEELQRVLGSSDIIYSQANFSKGEIDSNRNTRTTRTWPGSTETQQRGAKQGEAERTAEPTHNHGLRGAPFITKKGGETLISYCKSFSHASWRREHKRSKTTPLHLSYTLL